MDPEAAFWRQRYLELLQNHAQVVGIMVQHDQQAENAEKLTVLGEALKKRAQQEQEKKGTAPPAPAPTAAPDLTKPVNGTTKVRQG